MRQSHPVVRPVVRKCSTAVLQGSDRAVDYLFMKLLWYIVSAFLIGAFVGWYSCGRAAE
jgi:hypothetical protein